MGEVRSAAFLCPTADRRTRAVTVARKTDGVAEVVDQLVVKEQGFDPGHGREMMGREIGSRESKEPSKEEQRQ